MIDTGHLVGVGGVAEAVAVKVAAVDQGPGNPTTHQIGLAAVDAIYDFIEGVAIDAASWVDRCRIGAAVKGEGRKSDGGDDGDGEDVALHYLVSLGWLFVSLSVGQVSRCSSHHQDDPPRVNCGRRLKNIQNCLLG